MPEIEDLVNYAIVIAIAAAIILMITGRFIDLSVERQTGTQNRATINLLQKIVTESPFIAEDSAGNKLKLMIDVGKFDRSDNLDLLECCDSVQYDYRLAVGRYLTDASLIAQGAVEENPLTLGLYVDEFLVADRIGEAKFVGNPTGFEKASGCYSDFGIGLRTTATVPVNLCEDENLNNCEQGVAVLETVDSPLSQISYWITQACNSPFGLSKRIPLDPKDYNDPSDIVIRDNTVCLEGGCKTFECGSKEVSIAQDASLMGPDGKGERINRFPFSYSCNFARVLNQDGDVTLFVGFEPVDEPPEEKEEIGDLPPIHDEWTEDVTFHFSAPEGYSVENKITAIRQAWGEDYVMFSQEGDLRDSRIRDIPFYLNIKDLKENFPEMKFDCDGNCIDIRNEERVIEKLYFKSIAYRFDNPDLNALLTWKITDTQGKCIEQESDLFGGGKAQAAADWTSYVVDLSDEAIESYSDCSSDSSKSNLKFNGEISRIEFNSCEKWFLNSICFADIGALGSDKLNAVMVDHLYFEVKK